MLRTGQPKIYLYYHFLRLDGSAKWYISQAGSAEVFGNGLRKGRPSARPNRIRERNRNKKSQMENRKSLADATTRYFEQLESHALAEENALAEEMMSAANMVDSEKEI